MGLAYQPTAAIAYIAELEGQARQTPPSDLVNEPRDGHIVRYQLAVFRSEPWNREKRNALRARRSAFNSRKREIHYVFRDIVIRPGDEDLAALDQIVAVFGRSRGGGDVSQAASRVRFGQRHRSRPLAFVHRCHEPFLDLVASESFDQMCRAERQTDVSIRAEIRRHQVCGRHHVHQHRDLLATYCFGPCAGQDADLHHLPPQMRKRGVRNDPTVPELR